jgi:hypothetical protein
VLGLRIGISISSLTSAAPKIYSLGCRTLALSEIGITLAKKEKFFALVKSEQDEMLFRSKRGSGVPSIFFRGVTMLIELTGL